MQQEDPRLLALEGHVGDFLAARREAGRQNNVVAVGQHAHVLAVLVHDRQLPLAVDLRAAFGDEDDAGVEVALFTGDPLIDRVGDHVGDAAPVLRIGEELLAHHLLATEGIPKAELGAQATIGFAHDTADDQGFCLEDLPVLEARRLVGVLHLLDECGAADRREETGALEVGFDHGRNLGADPICRDEVGDGNRQGLHVAAVDVDFDGSACGADIGTCDAGTDQQKSEEESFHSYQAFQLLHQFAGVEIDDNFRPCVIFVRGKIGEGGGLAHGAHGAAHEDLLRRG